MFHPFREPLYLWEIFLFPFVSDLHCPIDWLQRQMVNKGLRGSVRRWLALIGEGCWSRTGFVGCELLGQCLCYDDLAFFCNLEPVETPVMTSRIEEDPTRGPARCQAHSRCFPTLAGEEWSRSGLTSLEPAPG